VDRSLTFYKGIPTIVDHDNGDFAIWESNSIIKYLLAKYDTENRLSFPDGSNESFLLDQWLTFQASGQVSDMAN
jgi:glutathione S-transferase